MRAFDAHASLPTSEAQARWLFRITTNICLNRLRDGNRRVDILLRRIAPAESLSSPTVDSALIVRELMKEVSPQLRELAVGYFVDEISQAELSARLGVPRRTVGYQLRRFRDITSACEAFAVRTSASVAAS